MVVKVRLRLKGGLGEVEAPAVANAGFESDEPEVMVPTRVARQLGLYPRLPSEAIVETYRAAGGRRFRVYRLRRGLASASVMTEDKAAGPIDIALTIAPREEDILMSDRAIDALGIVLLKPGEGLWRFADDSVDRVRRSV